MAHKSFFVVDAPTGAGKSTMIARRIKDAESLLITALRVTLVENLAVKLDAQCYNVEKEGPNYQFPDRYAASIKNSTFFMWIGFTNPVMSSYSNINRNEKGIAPTDKVHCPFAPLSPF
jgi:hypothetical protein